MKEVRIKMNDEDYKKLTEIAGQSFRSITKQVTLYLLRGMNSDRQEQEAVRE